MRGARRTPFAALALLPVALLLACTCKQPGVPAGASPGGPGSDNARAGDSVTGRTITKDVPHSTESVSDIREREGKEPLPPRGDVAIPSHRIQRGDNTVAPPPPSGAPAGNDNPGGATPSRTGGY